MIGTLTSILSRLPVQARQTGQGRGGQELCFVEAAIAGPTALSGSQFKPAALPEVRDSLLQMVQERIQ